MTTHETSVDALARYVAGDSTVAIGGTLFTRTPVELIQAVCRAKPGNLDYVSWGGGFPLEMLLESGLVSSATLCFSSLDIFGQAPRFRDAVENERLPLVELTAHALHQGLSAGRRRLPSEPMIWPRGSDLTELDGFPQAVADPVSGETVGAVPAIRPDVLLLHAQSADGDGNLEIYGARGLDLAAIAASKSVLATVDEIVDRHELGKRRNAIVIPHHFVTAWCRAPGGAYPTSSLPHYPADFEAILDWSLAASVVEDRPAIANVTPNSLASITVEQVTSAIDEDSTNGEPTVDEWMTCWLAHQYDNDSICSVGAVSPLAAASYFLAKATHAPNLTLIANGGSFIDVESRPLLFGLGEWLDSLTSSAHMGGDESYELYYQAGRVTHEVVSVAQVDSYGRTNNREVTSPSGRRIRLSGQGGMADVADMHRDFVIYLPRHSVLNTPESVSFATAARSIHSAEERLAAGFQPGGVRLITNLGAFVLHSATKRFVLEAVFPFADLTTLAEATGWALGIDDLDEVPLIPSPSEDELAVLRDRVDPFGLRRLEFVDSKNRLPLLEEIIAKEKQLANDLAHADARGSSA